MSGKTAYWSGVALTLLTCFALVWLSLAVGINGPDGEPFDRIYLGVFAVGLMGALVGKFRAIGMARALAAMACAQALVPVLAVMAGKHLSGVSPIAEIFGVNGIFFALFLGAAWLFRQAAKV